MFVKNANFCLRFFFLQNLDYLQHCNYRTSLNNPSQGEIVILETLMLSALILIYLKKIELIKIL